MCAKHLAVAALILAVAGSAAAEERHPYRSDSLGLSVVFPYAPKEQPSDDGSMIVAGGNADDSIAYMIAVTTVKDEVIKAKTSDQILEAAINGAVQEVKATLDSKSDITIGRFPGKKFTLHSGEFVADCRAYLVGNKLYLPMVISATGKTLPMTASDFHAGFELDAAKPAKKAIK